MRPRGPAGAIASDSPSLARWWRAFCAGEIVSQASLTEMSTFDDGYGLGLYNPADPYAGAVGHTGENFGYVSWAGCLPEEGAVVVVLSNVESTTSARMARPLVDAVRRLTGFHLRLGLTKSDRHEGPHRARVATCLGQERALWHNAGTRFRSV